MSEPTPRSSRPIFSSPRERRLWTLTAILVAGIYSTLGLTATLVDVLPPEVIVGAFVTGMLLVGIGVLTQGLRMTPGNLEVGVALGIAAVYFMVALRLTMAERSHLFEFGVVAVFICEALQERARQGRRVPVPALLAVVATTLIGVVDELIQWFLPSRVFDTEDMLFNFLASLMAVATLVALRWVRSRTKRRASG